MRALTLAFIGLLMAMVGSGSVAAQSPTETPDHSPQPFPLTVLGSNNVTIRLVSSEERYQPPSCGVVYFYKITGSDMQLPTFDFAKPDVVTKTDAEGFAHAFLEADVSGLPQRYFAYAGACRDQQDPSPQWLVQIPGYITSSKDNKATYTSFEVYG